MPYSHLANLPRLPRPPEFSRRRKNYVVPCDYPYPKQTIVVAVRTLNEQDNIERFCNAYSFATRICIADGGSTDNTLDLARQFENVSIYHFPRVQKLPNGMPFNPEGVHTEFAINCAKQHNPDWLIWDDVDSIGSPLLTYWARSILEHHPYPAMFVRRFYCWYDSESHFPDMDKGYALWAWKPKELDIYADVSSVLHPKLLNVPLSKECEWSLGRNSPYALLHYSWNSEQEVARKMSFYNAQGRSESHPLSRCGRLEQLPSWARD